MKDKKDKNRKNKYSFIKVFNIGVLLLMLSFAACSDSECDYDGVDCPTLNLNIGAPCSVNDDGNINGNVSVDCECIPG